MTEAKIPKRQKRLECPICEFGWHYLYFKMWCCWRCHGVTENLNEVDIF